MADSLSFLRSRLRAARAARDAAAPASTERKLQQVQVDQVAPRVQAGEEVMEYLDLPDAKASQVWIDYDGLVSYRNHEIRTPSGELLAVPEALRPQPVHVPGGGSRAATPEETKQLREVQEAELRKRLPAPPPDDPFPEHTYEIRKVEAPTPPPEPRATPPTPAPSTRSQSSGGLLMAQTQGMIPFQPQPQASIGDWISDAWDWVKAHLPGGGQGTPSFPTGPVGPGGMTPPIASAPGGFPTTGQPSGGYGAPWMPSKPPSSAPPIVSGPGGGGIFQPSPMDFGPFTFNPWGSGSSSSSSIPDRAASFQQLLMVMALRKAMGRTKRGRAILEAIMSGSLQGGMIQGTEAVDTPRGVRHYSPPGFRTVDILGQKVAVFKPIAGALGLLPKSSGAAITKAEMRRLRRDQTLVKKVKRLAQSTGQLKCTNK